MGMRKITIIRSLYPDSIQLLGFDKAILWITENGNIVYSIDKIKSILIKEGMDIDDVDEYIEFNIFGGHYGEFSPIYMYKLC
jgi:hydroxymethylpyrimidine pyrophosphatase-like HAD family hydrolase